MTLDCSQNICCWHDDLTTTICMCAGEQSGTLFTWYELNNRGDNATNPNININSKFCHILAPLHILGQPDEMGTGQKVTTPCSFARLILVGGLKLAKLKKNIVLTPLRKACSGSSRCYSYPTTINLKNFALVTERYGLWNWKET